MMEKQTRDLLNESTESLDGRVRSRLTQARHAALDDLRSRQPRSARRTDWRRFAPLSGVVAAGVLAVILWPRGPGPVPGPESSPGPAPGAEMVVEDLDLILGEDLFRSIDEDEGPLGG